MALRILPTFAILPTEALTELVRSIPFILCVNDANQSEQESFGVHDDSDKLRNEFGEVIDSDSSERTYLKPGMLQSLGIFFSTPRAALT